MKYNSLLPIAMAVVLVAPGSARADEKVLCERTSHYNTILVTEDDQGLRTLWFGTRKLQQTVAKPGDPEHIELAYVRAMPIGLALVEKPQRMLFVGLGGGSLPTLLHRHYPTATIDVVEIDPAVVQVATEFFGFREDSTMRVHVQDGRRFIEECRRPYDIIFLDAYGADGVPYSLVTREFLVAVRQALGSRGIAVANISDSGGNPLYRSMVRTYQDVFDELYLLDVRSGSNRVVIAQPYEGRLRGVDLARRVRKVSQARQLRFDMADFVLYGFLRIGKEGNGGRILTDSNEPGKPARGGDEPDK